MMTPTQELTRKVCERLGEERDAYKKDRDELALELIDVFGLIENGTQAIYLPDEVWDKLEKLVEKVREWEITP